MSAKSFFSSATGSKVNRDSGIIEGVSVITSGVEAKGHGIFIDAETLRQVKACADAFSDGVQVKADHGTGFTSIVGVLRNFRIEGNKLLADLHLLKSHEMRERVFEMAETMPGSIGLSISFSGGNEERDGKKYARCTELYSVDFVDRPAANPSGLFERVDSPREGMDSKSLLTKFKEFLTGVEKELSPEPVNFEAQAKELSSKLDTATKDLAAKEAEIKMGKEAIKSLESAIEKLMVDFETKEKNLAAEIEKQASAKALQITASQGQPAISQTPAANPADPVPAKTELKGLSKAEAAFKAQLAKLNA